MPGSTALTKRAADNALMPPPPPSKRIRRPPKILEEDEYTDALSHIIARDFFPGLLETETQQDFLNALDSGDELWIDEASQRVRDAMTPIAGGGRRSARRGVSMTPLSLTPSRPFQPGQTPIDWRGETPTQSQASSTPRQRQELDKRPQVNANLGLAAFQAKYTSEDNESFNALLDKQNAKRADKYRWLWNNNKLPSNQQLAQAAQQHKLLQRASDATDNPTALIPRPSQDQNVRKAMIDVPLCAPRNGLMFSPEDLSTTHPQHTTIAEDAEEASRAPPKAVSFSNTRLPQHNNYQDDDDSSIPQSPPLSAIDAAIRGERRPTHTTIAASSIASGNDTPRVNGYSFVDAEPTPSELSPRSDPDALLAQITAADTGPSPFSIADTSKRESLHHALVDKQNRSGRTPQNNNLAHLQSTPIPRFASSPAMSSMHRDATPRQLGALTPAARMLYAQLGSRGRTPVKAGNVDWTPGGSKKERKVFTPTAGVKRT